jgi:8-oxo-dGTP pyrophosphatase MutT (NUDIX family)
MTNSWPATPRHLTPLSIADVRAALRRPRPGRQAHITMAPQPRAFDPDPGTHPRQAGVLLLLYPADGALHLVLTVRSASLHHHSGQVSLPGGGWESGDRSLAETALREAGEETGMATEGVEILGPLTPVHVAPSNNTIHPFVGYAPHRPAFRPDTSEVAELLQIPVAQLLDPATRREEDWTVRGSVLRVPFFAIGRHKVWGATAIVLAEFLALLREPPTQAQT